jgi:hypothetical protein
MEQRMLVRETEQGAYLWSGPELETAALPVAATPHFDVFDWGCRRLILGKCSRLPDDEDQVTKRYGIDFHRALPPFKGLPPGYAHLKSGGPTSEPRTSVG